MIENSGTETQDETQKAQAELDGEADQTVSLKKELEESKNKYLYLYAEFETFKKRSIKERSDLIKFGHENLSRDLLTVADNLERALLHCASADVSKSSLVEGIKMVNAQLKETLSRYGIQMVPTVGTKFNPELHEAVGQEKISEELRAQKPEIKEGDILTELQKGYTLHGRLLRAARVTIAIS